MEGIELCSDGQEQSDDEGWVWGLSHVQLGIEQLWMLFSIFYPRGIFAADGRGRENNFSNCCGCRSIESMHRGWSRCDEAEGHNSVELSTTNHKEAKSSETSVPTEQRVELGLCEVAASRVLPVGTDSGK